MSAQETPPEWNLSVSVGLQSRTGSFGHINFNMNEAVDLTDFVTLADLMKDIQEFQKMIVAKYK